MGTKNIKDFQNLFPLNNRQPKALQKSKKDDDLNLINGQKVQEIFDQCSLIDFSNPLPEQLMSRLSTKIAECLMTMYFEYPDTDQFEHEIRLLTMALKKSKSYSKKQLRNFEFCMNKEK